MRVAHFTGARTVTRAVAAAVPPAVCAWQWKDATRKNYYAKYSARMVLGIHFFINIVVLPSVISVSAFTTYYQQVNSAMVSNAE